MTQRIVANLGCGPRGGSELPAYFNGWKELRVDADASVSPDIVADLIDLSRIGDESVDAIWASHCVEHLFIHQVPQALREFHRILVKGGIAIFLVPDLQTVANYFTADRPHEPIYQSNAGPISAHDIFYGLGTAIATGRTYMAHRCGFTPSLLQKLTLETPFVETVIRRRAQRLELATVLRKGESATMEQREALLRALDL